MPPSSVLVVDDSPTMRRALRTFLKAESDFEVCGEAQDGREAIEKAKQLHPDLIVTDLSMPTMNGLEAARVLKMLMPGLPVILFTAHRDSYVDKEAAAVGIKAVVSKHAGIAALIAAARSVLAIAA